VMQGGEVGRAELEWMSSTWWSDVRDFLEDHFSKAQEKWILDVGCGTGHFARHMADAGWGVIGVEPSRKASEISRSLGVTVYPSLEEFSKRDHPRLDSVTLFNLLEHVADPVATIEGIRPILDPRTVLVIRVPNDFSVLQISAQKKLNKDAWWVAPPDHVNYFDFQSLGRFLEQLGFETIEVMADFPMELFLLFGDDYVGNAEVGGRCHQKRIAFESAIPVKLRRDLYKCFARNGIGRNALVFAKMNKP
jgi:SAM-dependent methyltransferase